MLIKDGIEFRNLVEQVQKNKEDIAKHYDATKVLAEFGIRMLGRYDSYSDIENIDEGENYGNAYLIGSEEPYDVYVWTRANPNSGEENPYWLNIGPISLVGPEGPQGPVGPEGKSITIVGIKPNSVWLPNPTTLNDLSKAYLVGNGAPYDLYIQVGEDSQSATWNNMGRFNTATVVNVRGQYVAIFNADTKVDVVPDYARGVPRLYGASATGEAVYFENSSVAKGNTNAQRKSDASLRASYVELEEPATDAEALNKNTQVINYEKFKKEYTCTKTILIRGFNEQRGFKITYFSNIEKSEKEELPQIIEFLNRKTYSTILDFEVWTMNNAEGNNFTKEFKGLSLISMTLNEEGNVLTITCWILELDQTFITPNNPAIRRQTFTFTNFDLRYLDV